MNTVDKQNPIILHGDTNHQPATGTRHQQLPTRGYAATPIY